MYREMQEVRVFVDLFATASSVIVLFAPSATIRAYDECSCYLCTNLYGKTRMFCHVRCSHTVCEHCLYMNWHEIEEWEPLFKELEAQVQEQ